jgi:hypothetical protein
MYILLAVLMMIFLIYIGYKIGKNEAKLYFYFSDKFNDSKYYPIYRQIRLHTVHWYVFYQKERLNTFLTEVIKNIRIR